MSALPLLLASVVMLAAPAPEVSVAVMPLDGKGGVQEGTLALVSELALDEVRKRSRFARTLSPVEISAIMPREQQQALARCASNECALVDTEIAGALGVTHLMVGSVGRVGDSLVFTLKLLDLRTALAVGTMTERIRSNSDEALLDAIPRAVDAVLLQARLFRADETPPSTGRRLPLLAGGGALLGVGALAVVASVVALGAGASWLGLLRVQPFVSSLPSTGNRDLTFALRWAPVPVLLGAGAIIAVVSLAVVASGAAGVAAGAAGGA